MSEPLQLITDRMRIAAGGGPRLSPLNWNPSNLRSLQTHGSLTPEQMRAIQALQDKWNVQGEQYENSGMGKWSGSQWQPNNFEAQRFRSELRRAMGVGPEVSSRGQPSQTQRTVNNTFRYSDR